jgi:hypothetical protein
MGFVGKASAAGPIKIVHIWLDCTGDDPVGEMICSALREEIRRSRGFELVQRSDAEMSPASLGVHIVSEDCSSDGGSNYASALSVVFTLPMARHRESYWNSFVICVGRMRVKDMAEMIFAKIDKEAEVFQEF